VAEQKFSTVQVIGLVSAALALGGGTVGAGAKLLNSAAPPVREDLHTEQLRELREINGQLRELVGFMKASKASW
jgi:hypothetical protein